MANKRLLIFGCAVLFAASAITEPASAGFLDRLFGGFVRRAPVELDRAIGEPLSRMLNGVEPAAPRPDSNGPRTAFCVRTCDGHYFPVNAYPGMSATQSCSTFCPASETRIYSGSAIDHAVAADGARYADLPAAFTYRQHLVNGCTCNGRNAFGLASISVNSDPTLRPGDMVATETGLVTVGSKDARGRDFTPVAAGQSPARSTTGSGTH